MGGLRLAYVGWEAVDARAALVIVHGLGEHAGRYAEFAERMRGFGISTFAMDLRGHGRSDGQRGHVPSFDVFLQDLDRFRREVEGLTEVNVPRFLLGHSLGGLIAVRYMEEYARFDGAVIVSPWLATAMPLPRMKAAAARFLARVLPTLPFRSSIRADHLSHDTRIVAAYRSDPHVHGVITPRLFTEVSEAMGLALRRSNRIHDPVLVLLAGADHLVDTHRSVRFTRSVAAPDIDVRVYPDAYHEILNEVERAHVHREIADWIVSRI